MNSRPLEDQHSNNLNLEVKFVFLIRTYYILPCSKISKELCLKISLAFFLFINKLYNINIKMNIGLIGGGGREHILCQKIFESKINKKIVCFPGNAGTSRIAINVDVDF